jgi:hypothetical protein
LVGALEDCVEVPQGKIPQYCRALVALTMQLMQKDMKENETTGVDDLKRWPCDCHATQFLSSVASESSMSSLRKVSLTYLPIFLY